jgi:hypothetical protein
MAKTKRLNRGRSKKPKVSKKSMMSKMSKKSKNSKKSKRTKKRKERAGGYAQDAADYVANVDYAGWGKWGKDKAYGAASGASDAVTGTYNYSSKKLAEAGTAIGKQYCAKCIKDCSDYADIDAIVNKLIKDVNDVLVKSYHELKTHEK